MKVACFAIDGLFPAKSDQAPLRLTVKSDKETINVRWYRNLPFGHVSIIIDRRKQVLLNEFEQTMQNLTGEVEKHVSLSHSSSNIL
jgi:hypothetical protein